MRVSVWCRKSYEMPKTLHEGFQVWEGEMGQVPSVGDWLEIFDGWASEPVLAVNYSLHDGSVQLEIGPDYTGEYKDKVGG